MGATGKIKTVRTAKTALNYTQYRDAIRTVATLMHLPGTPAKYLAPFAAMQTEFEANGKTWLTAGLADTPAATGKPAGRGAKPSARSRAAKAA